MKFLGHLYVLFLREVFSLCVCAIFTCDKLFCYMSEGDYDDGTDDDDDDNDDDDDDYMILLITNPLGSERNQSERARIRSACTACT